MAAMVRLSDGTRKRAGVLGVRPMKINPGLLGVVVIAVLSVALVKSCSNASSLQSDIDVLRSDNSMQGQVIATRHSTSIDSIRLQNMPTGLTP